jgi:uncharacterized membrane protein YkvA (DUF1232 family)
MSRKPEPQERPKRAARKNAKGRMRNFLSFLPNMVRLLGRLLKDSRVPTAEKALFLAAIVYVVSPLDFIPDVFPFIGQVDDLYMVALSLLRMINRTDDRVVREHWSGGGDIVSLAGSIASIAPILLPQRVTRVLSSRVEMAPPSQVLRGITNQSEAIIREIPSPESEEMLKVDSRSRMPN